MPQALILRLDRIEWIWLAGVTGAAMVLGLLAGSDPRLAVGLALAGAFVVIVFADLTLGLIIFCAEPLGVGVEESRVALLAAILLVLSWLGVLLLRDSARNDFFSAHPGLATALGLFAAWAILSLAWVEDSAEALDSLMRYAVALALVPIVFSAVRNESQSRLLSGALVLGGVGGVMYALMTPAQEDVGSRLDSTFADPNELAAALIAAVALACGLLAGLKKGTGLRTLTIGAAGFCVVAIMLTVSRGGLLALAIMLLAALVLGGRWRAQIAVFGSVVALAGVAWFTTIAPQEDRERITQETLGEVAAEEGRATIWTVGLRMVKDKPIAGVGTGNFSPASVHYLVQPGRLTQSRQIIGRPKPQVAHNTFLGVLSELGVIGLTLFLSILALSMKAGLRAVRNFSTAGNRAGEALARSVIIALVGTLSAAFFISHEYNKQLWLLLGLAPALLAVSLRADGRERSRRADQPDGRAEYSSS